jgi:small subunit ribosomal protein S4
MKGITGENLLVLCESRLDNTAYRLGLSNTRSGARQLVSHRHITVNGEIVNIPSYSLKPGDVVSVREKSKSLEVISDSLASRETTFDWLDWDAATMAGKFMNAPQREMIPENIKEQLIVELYSK